jgi:uncharacterized protein (DUF779 family)
MDERPKCGSAHVVARNGTIGPAGTGQPERGYMRGNAGSSFRALPGVIVLMSHVMPPESIPGSARKVAFTPAARRVLAAVCRRDGQQAVLLAWPAGVAYLPLEHYVPNAFDVIVGHVEACPVYADTRRLALFRNSHVVLDATAGSPSPRHPTLSARP